MKPLMLAALVVQLTSAGGAGSGRTREQDSVGSSMKDVGKQFSTLKNQVSSLTQQFHEARERARVEAEQKKMEAEGAYGPQMKPATASTGAAVR